LAGIELVRDRTDFMTSATVRGGSADIDDATRLSQAGVSVDLHLWPESGHDENLPDDDGVVRL
jgi:hypothetical protein